MCRKLINRATSERRQEQPAVCPAKDSGEIVLPGRKPRWPLAKTFCRKETPASETEVTVKNIPSTRLLEIYCRAVGSVRGKSSVLRPVFIGALLLGSGIRSAGVRDLLLTVVRRHQHILDESANTGKV